MSIRFFVLALVISFCIQTHAQKHKIDYFVKKIETIDNVRLKEKYFDSLASVLYKSKFDENTKHQYLNKIISIAQHRPPLQNLYFKASFLKSKLYFRQGEFEKAIEETEKLKHFCKKTNQKIGFARGCILQGRILNRIDRYDEALKNYKSALSLFEKIDTTGRKDLQKYLINLYANIARLYMNTRQDSLADVYHIKTVNLAHKIHDYERISFFNNILGWKYFAMGNYTMAEKYFLKALKDSAKIKLKVYNISNHHALGEVYEKLKKPEKALYHDTIALDFFIKTNNNSFVSNIYNNIAKIYLQTKDFDKALEYNRKAVEVAEKYKINDRLILAKITLAKILIATKKYDKAQKVLLNLTKSEKVKEKLKPRFKSMYYKALADTYLEKNDFINAYKYLKLHLQFSDSVNQRKLRALSGTETKYQNELLRRRMLLEQHEVMRQKEQKQKLIYSIIFLIALILTGLYYAIKYYKIYLLKQEELKQTLQKIEKLNVAMFQKKQNGKTVDRKKDFKNFLKEKYGIYKIEILDVWESIANGLSQSEYVQKNRISENTVKAWRKELYKKLKQQTGDTKFSDYKAVIEYYKSLRDFEYFYSK